MVTDGGCLADGCVVVVVGFTLSNATFNALVMRYSHRDGKMYFDDFVSCVARMKTMFGE